ncbi:hypothetical protein [Polaromonas sp. UC242_47]|uniref:hypothetical protein n=1 Tax=Polaromonas sp. UC242_47 TaxID=3374626 RepID=UPI0037A536A7
MDYTQSNAFVVDAGTGFNRHEDNAAVPTAVTKKDMNSLIWSLMEVVKFGGQAGAQFDPAVPATYKVLLSALKAAFGGNVTTVNAANSPFVLTKDHAGLVIMDATAGNASVTLPAANALSALKFDFRRKDASANMATVNRAGADTIDGALTSFTLSPGKACKVASDGGAAWSTVAFVDGLKEGFSRCVNNASQSNAATPNSKVDLLADVVIVYSPATGETIRKAAPGTITNDVTVAGPAANGRDRAAVFPASSWVHFYWALNPSTGTLITLSSLQPPTAGPALPAGYTHWAYSHPQWYDGASILRRVYVSRRVGWLPSDAARLVRRHVYRRGDG